MQNKSAINAMVSCLTWTSVFVMGVIISAELYRALSAGAAQAWRLIHP